MAKNRNKLIFIGIFGVAMGALEAIVVVYLRQIYYPQGFEFPLVFINQQMISVEWLREIATIVMLASIGLIAGKDFNERFSYFLYTFAIWDVFYYVWLLVLLNWPSSLFTWDILFLIPVPWIGPVLAPIICSLTMILLSFSLIYFKSKDYTLKMKFGEWSLLFSGIILMLYTFTIDFLELIIQERDLTGFLYLTQSQHFQETISRFTPANFNWMIFILGELLLLFAIVLLFFRSKSKLVQKHHVFKD